MMSRETHGKEEPGRGGQATRACRSAAARRQESTGSGARGRGAATNRIPLARCAESRRHRRAARYEQGRAAGAIGGRGIVATICGAARGPHGTRLRHAAVDAQAGTALDRARVRRDVQRDTCVALARAAELIQPGARSTRLGTRRCGYRALAQAHLAGAKKNAARQGRLIVFIDESGVSERPTRVRTWGVRGETPIVQFHFNWHQLSLIAGMHFTGLCFRLHDGSIAKEQVVAFLQALRAYFRPPLLILWDNSRPHRSHLVRDYIASTAGRIQLHFLPGYAPELNPVEFLWGWLKRHALANFCPDTFAELQHTTRGKLKSAQRRSVIIASCWQQAELF